MAEYIKREDAIAILTKLEKEPLYQHLDEDFYNGIETAITELNRLPAAEVAEVRHGYWSWCTEDLYRCTVCNIKTSVDECMEEPMYKYCPNCGAIMDKED